jgi:hypothetical protein
LEIFILQPFELQLLEQKLNARAGDRGDVGIIIRMNSILRREPKPLGYLTGREVLPVLRL